MREPARSDLHHYQRLHHQIPLSNGHRVDSRVLEGRHFSPPRGRMETAPQEHERFIASLNHVRTPLGACANLVRATQGDALTLHLIGSADDL